MKLLPLLFSLILLYFFEIDLLVVSLRPVGFLFINICLPFVSIVYMQFQQIYLTQLFNSHFSIGRHPKLCLSNFGTTVDL